MTQASNPDRDSLAEVVGALPAGAAGRLVFQDALAALLLGADLHLSRATILVEALRGQPASTVVPERLLLLEVAAATTSLRSLMILTRQHLNQAISVVSGRPADV